jgi:hypothetical protein
MDYYNYSRANDGYSQADSDSIADSQSDLYRHAYYLRGNGRYARQKSEKQGRRNSDRAFMDQDYYYPSTTMSEDAYAHPLSVKNYYNRRRSSYDEMVDPNISPNTPYYYQQPYQDEPNYFNKGHGRRRQKVNYTLFI